MVNMDVGFRIRQYRKAAGLSQENLADKTGLSVIAISNIERGVNYPSFDHFVAIANAIGVSADELLVGVVDNSYEHKASVLSDKLADLEHGKRLQILSVLDTLLAQS